MKKESSQPVADRKLVDRGGNVRNRVFHNQRVRKCGHHGSLDDHNADEQIECSVTEAT